MQKLLCLAGTFFVAFLPSLTSAQNAPSPQTWLESFSEMVIGGDDADALELLSATHLVRYKPDSLDKLEGYFGTLRSAYGAAEISETSKIDRYTSFLERHVVVFRHQIYFVTWEFTFLKTSNERWQLIQYETSDVFPDQLEYLQ